MDSSSDDSVTVPLGVLWAALRGAAEGAAGFAAHGVLEHDSPITDAARPPDGFATVLAWAWRWNQRATVELLAMYLADLRDALEEPDAPPDQRLRREDALWSVATAVGAEHLLGDQGSEQLAARARAELPDFEARLRDWASWATAVANPSTRRPLGVRLDVVERLQLLVRATCS